MRSHARPTITGIAHVELSVSDVDASVAWYCRVLGAKDVWRGRNDEGGYRACAIREPVTGAVLAFTQHDRIEGGPFTPLRTGLDHLSFAVADDAALNAWSRFLDEIGIAHDPIDDRGSVVSMTLKDPDGIALEFYLLRPR
ncbi:MAG TPA: VOC family protein [Methylomirabilota bacterium]|nr:VOC family protein [Methylomirabilota bacterium]